MTECEKDFKKVLLKVKPLTDEEKESTDFVKSYNMMVKNGNLEVCVRKCQNNSPPMMVYDKNSSKSVEEVLKILPDVVKCLGVPSSETIDDKITYKCASGVYDKDSKMCKSIPVIYFPGATI
jgi:hypothetical protein